MDFTYILHTSTPDQTQLLNFGFTKTADTFTLKTPLFQTDFYAIIQISTSSITAELFEKDFDERYTLLDVPSAQGAFVGELRNKLGELMAEIQKKCFITTDVATKYLEFLQNKFDAQPEYPWEDYENMVFRCPNNKWFGLMMKIPMKKLGLQSEKKVWVVNLKADADKIPDLIDNNSIFPAWHMSKKYWITVLLTTITDFNCLCKLTERSYELVTKKSVKKN